MANYVIPENPSFNLEVRRFETTDRGHADTFNPVIQTLLENEAYLLENAGLSSEEVTEIVENSIGSSDLNAPGKPDIISSIFALGGNNLSTGEKVSDTSAQYDVIEKSMASTGQIFSTTVTLPKGMYSLMLRMKVSQIATSDNALCLDIKDGQTTTAKFIKPSMFKSANRFETLGCVADCTSGTLNITFSVAKAFAGIVRVDYLLIMPTMTSITSIG